ncbi:fungal-specific transcription factor domain-containing protein [Bisporella sp. PMI_857]|nr:fungal-specific transcription factor domain-containing protein [Bisporella sp. PMI_857]
MSEARRPLYNGPVAKAGQTQQIKPDITQNPSREVLPPISSLFGSSSSQPTRPAQSPYSDRDSPVFPTASPLDTRHPATPTHADRPFDGSYFQRPGSRQFSYGSRPDHVERSGIQPPPRPTKTTASPRFEGRRSLPDSARPPQHSTAHGWSPRAEGFARDTSSSFRAHIEHRPPPPIQRSEQDPRSSYRENPMPMTPNYPPTPASTVADEKVSKDALGPKIWTGTQFLPRFVRQAEVPGEGICYFYDDGTHCKTVIDGEVVNAHWGVTKAGKPRKRLAIACITCREKKIKCDPDYPRCVQCEKFGRVCKFKNAPRGGQGSPDTPPADADEVLNRPGSSRTEMESFKLEKRENSQSISPRLPLRHTSPESELHQPKRQRTGYSEFTPVASDASQRESMRETTGLAAPWMKEPLVASPIDHNLLRDWQVNPYTIDPALVGELVGIFFKHGPETAHFMFPQSPFKKWILSTSEKSLDDLMLIYTILALGTVFSSKTEHKALGIQYASISRYACNDRPLSLQLVQSRLILALYYFAINNHDDSWDYTGAALRAASGLKFNVELENPGYQPLKTFPYGLSCAGYEECRRRSLWSCYLMDRYNGFCSGRLSFINSEDVFLRLPSDCKSFDAQIETRNPYFSPSNSVLPPNSWNVGSMAHLVIISSIWGDVVANIYRTSHKPVPTASNPDFGAFYDKTMQKLHDWKASLPSYHRFSAANLATAVLEGKAGTFMTMHTLYHNTAMKLNRYIRKTTLTPAQLDHHHTVARQHAEDVLVMMDVLAARYAASPAIAIYGSGSADRFSSPIVGYAIVSAVDILSARFKRESISNRLASFGGSQTVLAELALFWQSAKTQEAQVSQRASDMAGIMKSGEGGEMCESRQSIEMAFEREYDSFYA